MEERPHTANERPQTRKLRVLVVDDEPLLLRMTARVLGRQFDVVPAGSAREALALLEQAEMFDAILCDLLMPEMTGMELYARLSERWPELAARVVFLTGGVFTRQAAAFLAECGRPQLDKPFSVEAVQQAVEAVAPGD